MIRSQGSREGVGIVGDPETGAEHHVFPWAERHAEARREQCLTDLDPQILRHGSDAADHHLVRVHVIALEARVARVGTGKYSSASRETVILDDACHWSRI